MHKKPLFVPMMSAIKPYHKKLMQAKQMLDEAWKVSEDPVIEDKRTEAQKLKDKMNQVLYLMSTMNFQSVGHIVSCHSLMCLLTDQMKFTRCSLITY